jgi:uncharacterized protein
MAAHRNVLGGVLVSCSLDPLTGYFRDGTCHCGPKDLGVHAVCVRLTAAFLAFSKEQGNDLSTPHPEYGFPGLQPGDRWCLCAGRWQQALEAGCAPEVFLAATSDEALAVVRLDDLKVHGVDAPERN